MIIIRMCNKIDKNYKIMLLGWLLHLVMSITSMELNLKSELKLIERQYSY